MPPATAISTLLEEVMTRLNACKTLVLTGLLLSASAFVAVAQEGHSWSYSGATGPDHWSEVSATCGAGKEQSPIDIANPRKEKLPTIDFSYHATPLKVINNGHTIQVNYGPGSSITRDGKTYDLVQFHFHHMSENAIKGQRSAMELHLVHKAGDGSLAVVAVMLKEGKANKVVNTVWSNISSEEGKENVPASVMVDAAGLLPHEHSYYTFPGSLTTPPCSEGVTWLVLAEPMTLSKEQIDKFAAIYPNNARPIQPLNGRVVAESK
jgi:carbonic anhydrase